MKIGIIITSYGSIDQLVYHNHLSCFLAWSKEFETALYHMGDNQQEVSLNAMTLGALQDGCDYLFYAEHDNIYSKDTLRKLLADDLDIVTGNYNFRNWPFAPIPLKQDEENGLMYRYECNVLDEEKEHNLFEVSLGCFGCCLVKADVLRKLFDKGLIFRREYNKKTSGTYTADVIFFKDARDNGYKIWVDGAVKAGHQTKNLFVTPDNYKAYQMFIQLLYPDMVPEGERMPEDKRLSCVKKLLEEREECWI